MSARCLGHEYLGMHAEDEKKSEWKMEIVKMEISRIALVCVVDYSPLFLAMPTLFYLVGSVGLSPPCFFVALGRGERVDVGGPGRRLFRGRKRGGGARNFTLS